MSSNEKKFLEELSKLFESYNIDEVRCEEKEGMKFLTIYSNSRYLAFRLFKDGTYYDVLSMVSEYTV